MSNFCDEELIIKDLGVNPKANNRTLYELMKPLTFEFTVNGSGGIKIKVPKGFVTDFASIPRVFWSIFPPNGNYVKASVIHDYLYRLVGCSRFFADAVFREAMFQLKVSTWKRLALYYVVRIFGGLARQIADTPEKVMDQFNTEE